MKNIILKHIIPLLLAFALGAIMFHGKTTPREKCIQKIPTKSINYITTETVPVIIKEIHSIRDTIHDTIKMPADSAALARDWLTKRFYNPTILNDTNGLITAKFMITKNRLASWQVNKKLFVHSYKIYQPKTRKVLLGGGILVYPDRFGIYAGGIYQDKHDRAFELMYDPINRGLFLSAFWKINFRKKK